MAATFAEQKDVIVDICTKYKQLGDLKPTLQAARAKGDCTRRMNDYAVVLRHVNLSELLRPLMEAVKADSPNSKAILDGLPEAALSDEDEARVKRACNTAANTELVRLAAFWENPAPAPQKATDGNPGAAKAPGTGAPTLPTAKEAGDAGGLTGEQAVQAVQAEKDKAVAELRQQMAEMRNEQARMAKRPRDEAPGAEALESIDFENADEDWNAVDLSLQVRAPPPGMPEHIAHKNFTSGSNVNYSQGRDANGNKIQRDYSIAAMVIAANFNPANFAALLLFLAAPLDYVLTAANPPFAWKLQSLDLPQYRDVHAVYRKLLQRFQPSADKGKRRIEDHERPYLRSLIAMFFVMYYPNSGFSFAELRIIGGLSIRGWCQLHYDDMLSRIATGPACPMAQSARAYIDRIRGKDSHLPLVMEQHYGEEYQGERKYHAALRELFTSRPAGQGANTGQASQTGRAGGGAPNGRNQSRVQATGPVTQQAVWSTTIRNYMSQVISQGKTHEEMRQCANQSQLCFRCLQARHGPGGRHCTNPEHDLVSGFNRSFQTYAAALIHLGIASA